MTKDRMTKWLVLAVGCSLVSAASFASDIYRWTDEDGNVHYGDRPTGQTDEQRVAIRSEPTDNSAVQKNYDDQYGSTASQEGPRAASGDDDEENRPPTRAERKAAAAERQAECLELSARLERMEGSRRLYTQNENGERVYMDDDAILKAREDARARVAEACD